MLMWTEMAAKCHIRCSFLPFRSLLISQSIKTYYFKNLNLLAESKRVEHFQTNQLP